MVELSEVQGLVVSGYGSLPYAHFIFVQIKDRQRARRWLGGILPQVTTATSNPKATCAINIGFTYVGLKRMNLGKTAQTFPREFREGMGNPARMHQLGDKGEGRRAEWDLGGNDQTKIHMLMMIYGATPEILDDLRREITRSIEGIFSLVYEQSSTRLRADGEEGFGFRDGISQPAVDGITSRVLPGQDVIKPGEFVLGYRDEYGFIPPSPGVPAKY
jgi:deferrochelatase/peroxidase EfeB